MSEDAVIWTTVVVTHNSAGDIEECLKSLQPDAASGSMKVIVVDNASSDGTAGQVAERFPWALLLRSPENGGFGAGNNIGLAHAAGGYWFFLNPDASVVEVGGR